MMCAVCGHDSVILTYSVSQNFKPLHRVKGHSIAIKFLDFCLDSIYILKPMKLDNLMELPVSTKGYLISKLIINSSQFKNETWASWT